MLFFLFNVYVNDLSSIDKCTEFVLYADNTSLFVSSDNESDLLLHANNMLSEVFEWSFNSLQINVKKIKDRCFCCKEQICVMRQFKHRLPLS